MLRERLVSSSSEKELFQALDFQENLLTALKKILLLAKSSSLRGTVRAAQRSKDEIANTKPSFHFEAKSLMWKKQ